MKVSHYVPHCMAMHFRMPVCVRCVYVFGRFVCLLVFSLSLQSKKVFLVPTVFNPSGFPDCDKRAKVQLKNLVVVRSHQQECIRACVCVSFSRNGAHTNTHPSGCKMHSDCSYHLKFKRGFSHPAVSISPDPKLLPAKGLLNL